MLPPIDPRMIGAHRTPRPRVAVLDYGSGNVRSAVRMLERLGARVELTADRTACLEADGLVTFDGLKLHPKGRVLFAWVKNDEELERLCNSASTQFDEEGRTPIVAFTSSRALVDRMANPSSGTPRRAEATSRKHPVPAAQRSFIAKSRTPPPSRRMSLLSCPPTSTMVRASGAMWRTPRAWQVISVTVVSAKVMMLRP